MALYFTYPRQGPVTQFPSGSKKCAACGEWVNDPNKPRGGGADAGDRPPKPADAACPNCKAALKTIFTKKGTWVYRCEPCNLWINVK